ncbi:MAG: (d)CMP kinase [Verrucomicrobiaceae bacterium]|nr:(d)CMP kinase [Verrucomicrobiaceae bacterium]
MASDLNHNQYRVIAIDGPAASGKSSVSQMLSEYLGFLHVNSGVMYRALAWSVLRAGIHANDDCAVVEHLRAIDLCCGISDNKATLTVGGVDPGGELKSSEVNSVVSAVSRVAEVRDVLVAKQREYLNVADIVMEGRDIGSVVFPETPYKFYIDASIEVRAKRRMKEGIVDDLAQRDAVDSSRETSPMVVADDAAVIDTSEMTLDEVLAEIIDRLRVSGLDALE